MCAPSVQCRLTAVFDVDIYFFVVEVVQQEHCYWITSSFIRVNILPQCKGLTSKTSELGNWERQREN